MQLIFEHFQTVLLSIMLGLLHGLVFLPVMLSWFVGGSCLPSIYNKVLSLFHTPGAYAHTKSDHASELCSS